MRAGRWGTHTEHVNSFSSTRLPLLLVPSAMVACASPSGRLGTLRLGKKVYVLRKVGCTCD